MEIAVEEFIELLESTKSLYALVEDEILGMMFSKVNFKQTKDNPVGEWICEDQIDRDEAISLSKYLNDESCEIEYETFLKRYVLKVKGLSNLEFKPFEEVESVPKH